MKDETSMDDFMSTISNAVTVLTQRSLYYFHTNFEQKKILIKLDMNDANYVESFYDLNPTEEQVSTLFILHKPFSTSPTFRCILDYYGSEDLADES